MLKDANEKTGVNYDFAGFRFFREDAKVICLKTKREVFLRRNLSEFLLLLLHKPREIVSYEEFRTGVTAWSIYKEVSQLKRTIHATKGELIKNLRVLREDFNLIESVPAKGYRLDTDVNDFCLNESVEKSELSASRQDRFLELKKNTGKTFVQNSFGEHWKQVFFVSTIYAMLFVVTLFLEIAYQLNSYKNLVLGLVIPVFLWIWLTSTGGLFVNLKLAQKSFYYNFAIVSLIFFAGAAFLHFFLGAFLPAHPITEANFQTYPAHAAYLKNIFYFCGLGVLLIVLPRTIVIWLRTRIDTGDKRVTEGLNENKGSKLKIFNLILLSPFLLLFLILLTLLFSILATSHLFENLKPGQYLNLFIQLALLRNFLYFALAIECLIWYWFSVYSLKEYSLKIP